MTERKTLQKAIDKAVANGFNYLFSLKELIFDPIFRNKLPQDTLFAIIFSHSFAKAYFGEGPIDTGLLYRIEANESSIDLGGEERVLPAWQHHLQNMVLEENPIEYLGRFL